LEEYFLNKMKNLKLVYSQTDIIETEFDKGISDIIQTYDLTKVVAREYNSKNFDQVELSKLSEPFKEFYNYKEIFFKKDWDKSIKNKLKRVTEGDYFFRYRASYEISFYDEEDEYEEDGYEDHMPKGSQYWNRFRGYFFDYCEKNDKWSTGADICNKPFDWQYRNHVRVQLVAEKTPLGKFYGDYEDQVTETEIDEKILQYEKEFEEKKLAIKKSWEQ